MNSTEEPNKTAADMGITWEVVDGAPIAHLHINGDLTFDELRQLGRQLYATLAEMEWSAATLLEAGARGAGMRNMHLLRKAEYEQNHSCAALCGKVAEWDMVYVLARAGRGGLCKKCLAMQEFAISLNPVEESEEGEHGHK